MGAAWVEPAMKPAKPMSVRNCFETFMVVGLVMFVRGLVQGTRWPPCQAVPQPSIGSYYPKMESTGALWKTKLKNPH
jgi:sugar phosphate permease